MPTEKNLYGQTFPQYVLEVCRACRAIGIKVPSQEDVKRAFELDLQAETAADLSAIGEDKEDWEN